MLSSVCSKVAVTASLSVSNLSHVSELESELSLLSIKRNAACHDKSSMAPVITMKAITTTMLVSTMSRKQKCTGERNTLCSVLVHSADFRRAASTAPRSDCCSKSALNLPFEHKTNSAIGTQLLQKEPKMLLRLCHSIHYK